MSSLPTVYHRETFCHHLTGLPSGSGLPTGTTYASVEAGLKDFPTSPIHLDDVDDVAKEKKERQIFPPSKNIKQK